MTDGSPVTRPVVVWNAAAGRKVGLPTNVDLDEDGVRDLFATAGLEIDLCATSSENEAADAVRDAARGRQPIVAAGGDGTVRSVARTLMDASAGDPGSVPALGILPLGSVMNLARSLSIPRELPAAIEIIASGNVRAIDVGEVVGWGPFFEAVAVGLHAELFAEGAALDAGDPVAPLRAIVTALRYQPSRMTLDLDQGRAIRTRALVTSISNGPFTGIGFTVAPAARLDDGLLDVRVFERFSRWELLRHFWSIAAGRRRYEPRVRTVRSSAVVLRSATPLDVRADGEVAGTTPIELRVRPGALRVIAPPA
ncbi:MAG TPA: YegS/Rv2252/BmrU family lipid kinase [Candidatus Limnocylindrales bacterium]|nr:YegS/Rv2252/BmrU family lipid kinase [Candidatus Limnocylindrales bacterium]